VIIGKPSSNSEAAIAVEIDQVAIRPAIEPYFSPFTTGLRNTSELLFRFIHSYGKGNIFIYLLLLLKDSL
jgi:hypothetical protein